MLNFFTLFLYWRFSGVNCSGNFHLNDIQYFNYVFVEQMPEMDSWLQQGFHKFCVYKETIPLTFSYMITFQLGVWGFFSCLAAVFSWELMFSQLTAIYT